MASGTKLQIRCGTSSGEKTWTFNYAKSNATTANIRALAQALVENGSIYKYPPLVANSAKLIVTSETSIDLV